MSITAPIKAVQKALAGRTLSHEHADHLIKLINACRQPHPPEEPLFQNREEEDEAFKAWVESVRDED